MLVDLVPAARQEILDLPERARERVLRLLLDLEADRVQGEPLGGRVGSSLFRINVLHLAIVYLVVADHYLVTEVCVVGSKDTAIRVDEIAEQLAALEGHRRGEAAQTMIDLVAASPSVRRIDSGDSRVRRPNLEALEALCDPAS